MGYLDETGLSRVWNRIKAYIQSLNYTSNIGTVTGITMNNTSYSPINGDVDIGTVVTDVSGKANTADLATVAISGSYVDLDDKPTIPTVPTTLSSFTDDLGSSPTHTHSQYLTSHQDLSNYIQKSSTSGLVKNDGTIDTSTYLTQHQNISNYIQKSNTTGLVKNDGTIDTNTYLTTAPVITFRQW